MLTGLGTGHGTWGASNLQITKLTTVQSEVQKRREVPVLPASLETFVQAIELLAEKRPCEVGLIGVGHGDTRFGSHILASFPIHDPCKGKRMRNCEAGREGARLLQIDGETEHHATIYVDDHGQQRSLDRLAVLLINYDYVHGRMADQRRGSGP